MKKTLRLADLFCGAGGTSTGAVEAGEHLGYRVELTAINHWQVAINTHTENHPHARHLCTSIDDVNPRSLYAEGELDVLWASPECTHHSVARGGKPINDQSRATAWCVVRWAEALRPNIILVENVPEFLTWGPIDSKGRPMKSRRGEVFHAWVATLEALGYKVGWRVLCAADYGDPTTRKRLFVQAVRGRRRVTWPDATHAPLAEADLFGATRKRWVPAREIIDWQLPAQSIYERKKPLSPKTINRIFEGLRKFGLKSVIVPQHSSNGARSVDEPAPTVTTTSRGVGMAEPFIVPNFGERKGQTPRTHPVDQPLPTITSHGAGGLVQPFVVTMEHQGSVRSIERPIPTVTTAKGGAMGVAQPFLVRYQGDHAGRDEAARCAQSVDDPVSTVTVENRFGLAQPFIIGAGGSEYAAKPQSVEVPVATVTTENHRALVQPFIMSAGGPECPARSTEEPMGTVLTRDHRALVDPFLVKFRGTNDAASIEQPSPTVTASGTHLGLASPFLVQVAHHGEGDSRTRDLDSPLPTVCGNRGEWAVCDANAVLPQHGGGALRTVDEPCPTVTTDGAVALVEPFLIEYYGTAGPEDLGTPLNTVTSKDRHALVRPIVVINGQQFQLDIRFRMLQPHELAAAQGFRRDHKFTGNKTDQVKQIGNAVPRRLARAIVLAALTQNADVSGLIDLESAAG